LDEVQELREHPREKGIPTPAFARAPERRLELPRNRALTPKKGASEDRSQMQDRRQSFLPEMQSWWEGVEGRDELVKVQIERSRDGGWPSACE